MKLGTKTKGGWILVWTAHATPTPGRYSSGGLIYVTPAGVAKPGKGLGMHKDGGHDESRDHSSPA